MPVHRQTSKRRLSVVMVLVSVILLACTGPEPRGATDPSPTPTPTVEPTPTDVPPTPTMTPEPSPTPSPSPTATATVEPTSTATAEATLVTTPVAPGTPTIIPTPPDVGVDITSHLLTAEDLPSGEYELAEEGQRSAQDLANAYSDPVAHLQRLEGWGFRRHLFRSFNRFAADDQHPYFVLGTINQYGSDEQAEDALQWLRRSQTTLGAVEQDAPALGDERVALTVATAQGTPTASLYIRVGEYVYIFFAEGGESVATVRSVAERVFDRIEPLTE